MAVGSVTHQPPQLLDDPLPPPRAQTQERAFGMRELGSMRHFVAAWAREEMLGDERRERLVLAVNELATNSVRHGGGSGRLRVWRESDTLLCEVRDGGHMTEPFVGERCPGPQALGGRGLWIVNQLCDLVQLRSSALGTVVRTHTHVN